MRFIARLRTFFRKEKLDADMSEEMREHLELQTAANVRAGQPLREAALAARKQFGHVDGIAERCREQRGFVWWEQFLQDLRFGFRAIRRSPGFTVTVVLTLALGIGVNAMIFSIFNAMVLKPAPVPDGAQMVRVHGFAADAQRFTTLTYPDYAEYRDQSTVFSGLIAFGGAGDVRLSPARAEAASDRINVLLVSGNYFDVLRAPFALGRGFRPEEDATRGTHPVVVLSHGFWQRYFGADTAVIGKPLGLNGRVYSVIGVASSEFRGTRLEALPDVWMPMMMQPDLMSGRNRLEAREEFWLQVDGRLKPGVSRAQAQEDMSIVARRLDQSFPRRTPRNIRVLPSSLTDPGELSGKGFMIAIVSFAAPGMLLLIACANVGNLLLARAATRSREMAIRLSLGAGRSRLLRQMLAESLLLGLLGSAGGLLLTTWLAHGLAAFLLGETHAARMTFSPDANVLGYVCALSLLTPLIFGLAPALRASRGDLAEAMKQGGASARGATKSWLQDAFVIGQLTFSFVLLIVAGLLMRTLHHALTVDPGIKLDQIAAIDLNLPRSAQNAARATQLHRLLIERLEAHPDVAAIGSTHYVPGAGSISATSLQLTDGEFKLDGPKSVVRVNRVSPDYFAVVGLPVVLGRSFTREEAAQGAALTVATEAAAQRFWPGENPIGKHYRTGPTAPLQQVIGVVPNTRNRVILEDEPEFYQLLGPADLAGATLLVRTQGEPAALLPTLANEARALDQHLRPRIFAVAEKAREQVNGEKKLATLASTLGGLALLLAAIGLYGVVAFFVGQRTAEIGLRLALGATRRDVMQLVIRRGLRLVAWGSAIGGGVALACTQALRGMLFGVTPGDPLTFGGVALVLAGVALLAGWLPARRATRVDPVVALRAE